jgi:hypothetical protein
MLDILSLVTALLNRKVWKFNVGTFQSLIEIPLKDQLTVKPQQILHSFLFSNVFPLS